MVSSEMEGDVTDSIFCGATFFAILLLPKMLICATTFRYRDMIGVVTDMGNN